jgi:AraC family transcriptional regulator of adaptative response/methylated-DNA-[protein]-cysteine methyltransferase
VFRDGPLRIRPPEEIRFGTGRCALGAILVALSSKGVVTLMIRDKAAELLRHLQARFPKAVLLRDEKGCKAAVAKAIKYVAWPSGRFGMRLDLRGTPFQQQVLREVLKIPFGKTSDYSTIASAIGAPKAVRAVGSTCTHNWWAFAVPCHRVLHKGGGRRDTPQYRWAEYEAGLAMKQGRKRARPAP